MDRRTDPGALTSPPTAGSRFVFELADERDDGALRELLRQTPLGGSIQTTLRREPNYFDGAATEGPFHQVLVARDTQRQCLAGMATRSVRRRFVDGRPVDVGYLGGLRLRPDVRNGTILARGFRALRQLHADERAPFYLTSITAGNEAALNSLARPRADLPAYVPLGRYHTFFLSTRTKRSMATSRVLRSLKRVGSSAGPLEVRELKRDELPQWLDFLRREGAKRQFFPALDESDFSPSAAATYRGLDVERIVVALRDGRIVGTVAPWDQAAYKQSVIERYEGPWRWGRHVYNLAGRVFGWPRFPPAGGTLDCLTLALPVVSDSDPVVWTQLLDAVRRSPVAAGRECLMTGLSEFDPLASFIRLDTLHTYVTQIYLVTWDDPQPLAERFAGRDFYLELGCL